jgi:hypothetical protein|tara:strand:+ start:2563 stop:2751 length:189 start_codon:yes stop_codon:yes gene_type:complete
MIDVARAFIDPKFLVPYISAQKEDDKVPPTPEVIPISDIPIEAKRRLFEIDKIKNPKIAGII